MEKNNNPQPQDKLTESITELDKDVRQLDTDIKTANKQNRSWPSFWRGLVSSLGGVIGATLLIALILYILQRLSVLPVIGEIFKLVLDKLKHPTQ